MASAERPTRSSQKMASVLGVYSPKAYGRYGIFFFFSLSLLLSMLMLQITLRGSETFEKGLAWLAGPCCLLGHQTIPALIRACGVDVVHLQFRAPGTQTTGSSRAPWLQA